MCEIALGAVRRENNLHRSAAVQGNFLLTYGLSLKRLTQYVQTVVMECFPVNLCRKDYTQFRLHLTAISGS